MTKLKCVYAVIFFMLGSVGQADDIEEAQPLEDITIKTSSSAAPSKFTYRGYFEIEYARYWNESRDDEAFPNIELSASAQWKPNTSINVFADYMYDYERLTEESTVKVNQIGIRTQLSSDWQIALGKERARKSPGLIISPSDFIFIDESLPGMREQREGMWLGRLSWQTPQQSADVIIIPYFNKDRWGWPDHQNLQDAAALRYFYQTNNFDVGFQGGHISNNLRLGAFAQYFITKVTKIYFDVGYTDKKEVLFFERQHAFDEIFGVTYDGISDVSLRAEIYHNQAGLNQKELDMVLPFLLMQSEEYETSSISNFLLRQWYLIMSLNILNMWHESDFTFSTVNGLDERSHLVLARYKIPLSQAQELGLSVFSLSGSENSSFELRPFDWSLLADWQYSF